LNIELEGLENKLLMSHYNIFKLNGGKIFVFDVEDLLKTADKMCKKADGEDGSKEGGIVKLEPEATSTTLKATSDESTVTTELATTQNSEPPTSATTQMEAISPITNIVEPNDGQKDNGGCFERIPGHSLRGTAAGLERGVSMAECECLCANSLFVSLSNDLI
jgi:hypothetical protein